MSLYSKMLKQAGPAPCDGCQYSARCKLIKLACVSFWSFVNDGYPAHPMRTVGGGYRPKYGRDHSVPNRQVYAQIFRPDSKVRTGNTPHI